MPNSAGATISGILRFLALYSEKISGRKVYYDILWDTITNDLPLLIEELEKITPPPVCVHAQADRNIDARA